MATFNAVSGVIGSRLAVPRIPSVPKSFRVIAHPPSAVKPFPHRRDAPPPSPATGRKRLCGRLECILPSAAEISGLAGEAPSTPGLRLGLETGRPAGGRHRAAPSGACLIGSGAGRGFAHDPLAFDDPPDLVGR